MAYGKTEEILLDYASSGALAAGNSTVTAPVQVSNNPGGTNGSLNTSELGEMLSEELTPPFDANGNEQLLDNVQLILDGTDPSAATWQTSGRATLLTTPPGLQTADALPGQTGAGHRVYFSPTGYGGILEAIKVLNNPLPGEEPPDTMGRALIAASVPRYSQRAVVQYSAGAAAVTAQWLDRYIGHRFLQQEVDDLYGSFSLGGHVRYTDSYGPAGARTFEFDMPAVRIASANWSLIPGGPTATVKPYRRWAIGTQPTAGNQSEYDLTWTGAGGSQVGTQYNNMDWDLTKTTDELYVFYQFMVRALQMSEAAAPVDLSVTPQNLATQYLRQQGYVPSSIVPKNAIPASDVDNPQIAGWVYPTAGGKQPARYRVPRPLMGAYRVVAGTRATVAYTDNGQVQAANTVGAIVGGIRFKGITNLKIS